MESKETIVDRSEVRPGYHGKSQQRIMANFAEFASQGELVLVKGKKKMSLSQ
jgi:UDP-N-acetylmuramyl pentapeptide synthase